MQISRRTTIHLTMSEEEAKILVLALNADEVRIPGKVADFFGALDEVAVQHVGIVNFTLPE
jgi:hypothetical protein